MNLNIVEQIKFKLTGRKVPVFRVSEVDQATGRIISLQDLGQCRDNPNSLEYLWDQKGYEKDDEVSPIIRISTAGDKELIWFVDPHGMTANLYTKPHAGPAMEKINGALLSVDVIAIAMGLVPSMRDKIIFLVVGVCIGWLFVGPMFSTMAS